MTNMHRVDENRVITDVSKVSNSDSVDGKVRAGKKRGMGQAAQRRQQRQREEATAVINTGFRSCAGCTPRSQTEY